MTTGAHLSISFSGEELLVLAADLGHDPARTGARLPELWTRRERDLALEVARRSLRSRRIIQAGAEGLEVAYAVAVLMDVLCAPAARLHVYQGDSEVPVRYLIQPDAAVRAELSEGLYRLTPLATVDLLGWIGADTGLTGQQASGRDPVELAVEDYLRARKGDASTAVPPELLASLQRTHAVSVRRHSGQVLVGGEVAWADGADSGLWTIPTFDQPLAGPASDLVPEGLVRLTPASAEGILQSIADFLSDEIAA